MSKSLLVKWALPIALVLSLVASFTVVGAAGGGSDDMSLGSDDFASSDFADFNPAYESVILAPPEESVLGIPDPAVLYSIDVDSQATAITLDGGDVFGITITNLIEAPIANLSAAGLYLAGLTAQGGDMTENGDLIGNVIITAEYQGMDDPGVSLEPLASFGGGDGSLVNPVNIIEYDDVIVHPGKTVVIQVPIAGFPAYGYNDLGVALYKAVYNCMLN